jgi:hypothetical protein
MTFLNTFYIYSGCNSIVHMSFVIDGIGTLVNEKGRSSTSRQGILPWSTQMKSTNTETMRPTNPSR